MSKENRFSKNIQIKNRKASFEYHFIETYIAGIALKGTEIKSLREGKANLQDAYCVFLGDEIWVKQMHISPYTQAAHFNHDLTRERKLLLNKKEINKLKKGMQDKGNTMIPTKLFINDRGLAKLEIALAKGKKLHDKRENIKEKDIKRELEKVKY
jgi:SsrA-binding protein